MSLHRSFRTPDYHWCMRINYLRTCRLKPLLDILCSASGHETVISCVECKTILTAKLLASSRKRKSFMDFDAVRNWVGAPTAIDCITLDCIQQILTS